IGRRPARERGERELRVACLRDGAGALAVRLPDGRSNGAWVRHAVETRRHEEAEEKRVFYVACTRAQDRLLLVNSALTGNAPWRARLDALGYRIAAGPAFPPPATLDGGLVEHVVVAPPAPARVMAADADLESIAVAAAEYSRVVEAAAAAGEILRGFLRSTLGARLAKAQVLGREVPILHRDASGRTWTGACDLILREGGAIVVVDYKTDVVDGDPAVAAETYRAQLEIY